MLSGEFAVLLGARAALLPVPRWLDCRASAVEPAGGYSVVLRAARALLVPELMAHEQEQGVPHLAADRSAFFAAAAAGREIKLGLGLSAAEAVGMLALRFQAAGHDWTACRPRICELALIAHASAQGGLGSGADVAACSFGQPLIYSRLGAQPPRLELMAAAAAPCCPLALLWSGQAADTRLAVKQFLAAVADGRISPAQQTELVRLADEAAGLWFAGSAQTLLLALEALDAALTASLALAGVSYRLPVHTRIEEWARRHGGFAKPAGAGGGDMILLAGELPLSQLSGLMIQLSG